MYSSLWSYIRDSEMTQVWIGQTSFSQEIRTTVYGNTHLKVKEPLWETIRLGLDPKWTNPLRNIVYDASGHQPNKVLLSLITIPYELTYIHTFITCWIDTLYSLPCRPILRCWSSPSHTTGSLWLCCTSNTSTTLWTCSSSWRLDGLTREGESHTSTSTRTTATSFHMRRRFISSS